MWHLSLALNFSVGILVLKRQRVFICIGWPKVDFDPDHGNDFCLSGWRLGLQ